MAWTPQIDFQSETTRKRIRTTVAIVGAFIFILAILVLIKSYQVYQTDLPSFEQLHNIEPSLSTRVYDRNGVLLKEFYSENRALTPYADLPKPLIDMLLASEEGVGADFMDDLMDGDERYTRLKRQIPVRLLYRTAYYDGGVVRLVPDIYGWDDPIAAKLGLGAVPPRRRQAGRLGVDVGP